MDNNPLAVAAPVRSGLRRYSPFLIASVLAALIVISVFVCEFGARLCSINNTKYGLSSSLASEQDTAANISKEIDNLRNFARYQACSNRHVAGIKADMITALERQPKVGYVASSWTTLGREMDVHFLPENLHGIKTCSIGAATYRDSWNTHRFFRSSTDNEAVFYSYPTLYFIRKSDCRVRSLSFEDYNVTAVAEGRVAGEYLIVYGKRAFMNYYGPGAVNLGLVNSARKLAWSKKIAGDAYFVYDTETEMIKLKDGRYALSYTFCPPLLQVRKDLINAHSKDPKYACVCIAIIEVGETAEDVKTRKVYNDDIFHIFGLVEADNGNILGLGRQGEDMIIVEVSKGLTVVRSKLVAKKKAGHHLDYGGAYRVSATKYAFAAESVWGDESMEEECYDNAFIYDYSTNTIAKSARFRVYNFYPTHSMNPAFSAYPNGGGVLAVGSWDGYLVLPANGKASVVRGGPRAGAGFWHMVAARDGGYLVHRPSGDSLKKIWKLYPWQNEQEQELNCTGVL